MYLNKFLTLSAFDSLAESNGPSSLHIFFFILELSVTEM
jgi:hypothetical protein